MPLLGFYGEVPLGDLTALLERAEVLTAVLGLLRRGPAGGPDGRNRSSSWSMRRTCFYGEVPLGDLTVARNAAPRHARQRFYGEVPLGDLTVAGIIGLWCDIDVLLRRGPAGGPDGVPARARSPSTLCFYGEVPLGDLTGVGDRQTRRAALASTERSRWGT